MIGSHTSKVCEQARDLESRRPDLGEARGQLAAGLVQATHFVGSGCLQERKGRQIFEEQCDQDFVRD